MILTEKGNVRERKKVCVCVFSEKGKYKYVSFTDRGYLNELMTRLLVPFQLYNASRTRQKQGRYRKLFISIPMPRHDIYLPIAVLLSPQNWK